ncbi:hypothetical protein [Flavobacterium terrisoli]|uniref:hypothetical protein n=1 Tax=Flavobacterium terrisoli TaxID=3242195 RepID=UPI00254285A7|nr:hypothetical protein [Flavobacterium buctense]
MKHLLLTLCIIYFFTVGCSDNDATGTEKRSFYMGVTPWPGDFTLAEVDTVYQFINEHCDMVSHHFDDGIPYEEAFNNQPMPVQLQQDVQNRITRTSANKKILLSVSALNLTRIHKADYYANSTVSGTIQDNWENLPVNHPDVIMAYKNYMSWLIDSFQPDYINYGVESNVATFPNADFALYKDFLSQIYPYLKNKYPNIPLFVSFIVDETTEGLNNANQLIPYTDYVGLSAYPYVTVSSSAGGNTNPALFPANYFERFINLANKPLVIAETAYIAENLVIPSFSLNKQGTEAWQKDYLEKMCQLCNTHQAEFIIWFCSKDYDHANQTLVSMGLYQDLFGLWQDTGLKDQNGNERLAYDSWLQWMAKQKN